MKLLSTPLPALALAVVAGTAACTQAPRPAPTPAASAAPRPVPAPQPTATPVPTAWIDRAQTPGDWRLQTGGGTTSASFGESASEPRFTLRCTPATRQVALQRAGESQRPIPLTIRTETRSATLTAQPVAGAQPAVAATLPGSDPLLDAMAITKGRFAVEAAGLPPLYLPAWAEVTRVIEDCR